MKKLLFIFLLVGPSLFAANPSFKDFYGDKGSVVSSNGNKIHIDASPMTNNVPSRLEQTNAVEAAKIALTNLVEAARIALTNLVNSATNSDTTLGRFGSLTVANAGSGTLNVGNGKVIFDGSGTIFIPTSAGLGKVFTSDGTGFGQWQTAASAGVTSVAFAVPSNVSGTNGTGTVTSTGTLGYTNTFQSPNLVFAGPTSGSKAEPAFRALVAADIPTPTETTLAYAVSTVTLDFSSTAFQFIALTNDVTFTNANQAAVKSIAITLQGWNTNCNLTFPANWQFLGGAPSLLVSNKWAMLSLTARGTSPTNVYAAYAVQP